MGLMAAAAENKRWPRRLTPETAIPRQGGHSQCGWRQNRKQRVGVSSSGDIDNRLKTFFDALRLPKNATELGDYAVPLDDETPFFCLPEDDSLITRVSVETDLLLDPPKAEPVDIHQVRLIVTVNIRPAHVTMFNLSFA